MRRSRLAWMVLSLLSPLAAVALASSCGARTGLEAEDPPEEDAGTDAPPDVPPDMPPDVPPDMPPDVPPDVPEDGLLPCEPDLLYIYLVTSETDLYRYRPDTGVFTLVGNLSCSVTGATPFSMGVERSGSAYVVYNDGELYRVSTADASCESTEWVMGTGGFITFGMGFAIDDDLMGETLHVAEINFMQQSFGLGTIDTGTFDLDYIGPFSDNLGNAIELTSSDDGKLYGYFLDVAGDGGWVVEVDKHTATILSSVWLPAGNETSALAFAYWGGDFYVFTSEGDSTTTVTKYSPADGTVGIVATLNRTVVGAGVSTCSIP